MICYGTVHGNFQLKRVSIPFHPILFFFSQLKVKNTKSFLHESSSSSSIITVTIFFLFIFFFLTTRSFRTMMMFHSGMLTIRFAHSLSHHPDPDLFYVKLFLFSFHVRCIFASFSTLLPPRLAVTVTVTVTAHIHGHHRSYRGKFASSYPPVTIATPPQDLFLYERADVPPFQRGHSLVSLGCSSQITVNFLSRTSK